MTVINFNDRRQVAPPKTTGTISHARARDLAAGWNSPEGSSLRALGSAGTITPHLTRELNERMPEATTRRAQRHLSQLTRYADKSGVRGPVRGWSDLQDAPKPKPGYQMPASTTENLRAAEQEITQQQRRRR